MLFGDGGFDWINLVIILAVVGVGWMVLRTALRLTMKVFTLGCTGLLILVAVVAAASWLAQ